MPLTNFSNGITSFGVPVVGSGIIPVTTGTYFFVDSVTGSSGNDGLSPNSPLATLAQAVAKCTATKGDVIVLFPTHAENVSSAGAISINVSGVSVIGLGRGKQRPTFTLDTATSASITITAANVMIKNCVFIANLASIVTVFTVTGNEFWLEGCDFIDSSTILNFVNIVSTGSTANTCDGLSVVSCKVTSLAAGFLGIVLLGVSSDRFFAQSNYVSTLATGVAGGFIVRIATFNITNALIVGNVLALGGANDVTTGLIITGAGAASSGMIVDNRISGIITTPLLCAVTLTMGKSENYINKTTASSGTLLPAAA